MGDEKTLAEVRDEFWWLDCQRDVSGMYFAREKGEAGTPLAKGESPQDLCDEIVRALARRGPGSNSDP